ncbi:LytTR family DNA-binding domain-containing protein [Limibacter armeniacum]|uniref:LytR/AlgR family response regulator transcription factor n=1 Tax=Limibacter armeniacum TaxID=466084 RepID=UPI002FE613AD
MRVIIIDDERLARSGMRSLLAKYDDVEVVDEANNVDEAFDKIIALNPEVIFLDIQMPGKSAFELLEMLPRTPLVVFATAYDEYAIKAFETNALDYLLKPIEPKRLDACIEKLRGQLESKPNSPEDRLKEGDRVFVKDGERCWFVQLSDIRMFESEGNYVKVYFEGETPLIHRSLNALDEKLDDKAFFRASRKYIINLRWIDKIEPWFNGGLMVKLKNGESVEISRRQAVKFKEMLSI